MREINVEIVLVLSAGQYCTRQYQDKKRLLIHQREKHLELLPHEMRIADMVDDTTSSSSASEEEEEVSEDEEDVL